MTNSGIHETSGRRVLRMATRGSALALAQSSQYAEYLSAKTGHTVETVVVRSEGDEIVDRPLHEIGGKGLFTKRLEEALLRDEADFAVHSLKDLPYRLPDGFMLAACARRADPRDVVLMKPGADMSTIKKIGTGSPRRVNQLLLKLEQIECHAIRGNIGTRIARVRDGDLDGVVLAKAGLDRLSPDHDLDVQVLGPDICLPAAGQGILGIECLAGRQDIAEILSASNDDETGLAAAMERYVLELLEADCTLPVAAFARTSEDGWLLEFGLYGEGNEPSSVARGKVTFEGPIEDLYHPEVWRATVATAVETMLVNGGQAILETHKYGSSAMRSGSE